METTSPTITLDLPNYLIDFLFHEFKTVKKSHLKLDRDTDIGRFISSMWESSALPVRKKKYENPIELVLPINNEDHYTLSHSFIYISELKRRMIFDYLKTSFELRRERFFHEGYKMGYRQLDIIEAFMKSYGMKNNSQNFDQLKKMDYRKREHLRINIAKVIQRAL